MFAQGPLTSLVVEFGWRNALMLDGMLGMVIALLVYAFVQDNPSQRMAHLSKEPININHTFFQALRLAYGNTPKYFSRNVYKFNEYAGCYFRSICW